MAYGTYTDGMQQLQQKMGGNTGILGGVNPGGTGGYMDTSGASGGAMWGGAPAPTQQPQAPRMPSRMPGQTDYLNQFLQQSSMPASANDPQMRGAINAGRVADQRTMASQRSALAERLGATGLSDSGAMAQKTGAINQQVGERAALRESGMVMDEQNARRNALMQALGLDNNRYQFDNDLGYRMMLAEMQGNQAAMQPFF